MKNVSSLPLASHSQGTSRQKPRIAVLMGGWSFEREVSLASANGIIQALTDMHYHVVPIDVTRDALKLIRDLTPRPCMAINALHGTMGEDGVIQGFLDMLGITYSHENVASSAVAMDKALSRRIFQSAGMQVPPWHLTTRQELIRTAISLTPDIYASSPFSKNNGSAQSLCSLARRGETPLSELLQETYVIKPPCGGSSQGTFIVEKGQPLPHDFLDPHWPHGDAILVEKYLQGREIQVGVMGAKALGAIEIKPSTMFYDYDAKYTDGLAAHVMPAPLAPALYDMALSKALCAHNLLQCTAISRSDFILCEDTLYIMELNTQPGMTSLSLFPEIAAHSGVSFQDILQFLIEHAQNPKALYEKPNIFRSLNEETAVCL